MARTLINRIASVLAVVLIVATCHPARALALDVREIPAMPNVQQLSPEQLESSTKPHEEQPAGDPALAYTVRLPATWEKSAEVGTRSFEVSRKVVGEIARYYSPPKHDLRSRFSVQAVQLEAQISAPNWFIHYVLSNGYVLQGLHKISSKRVEGLFVLIEADISYVVRAAAEINGSRIILAFYHVPFDYWREEAALQAAAISSFTLLDPDEGSEELLATFNFVDLAEFEYPASWTLRAPEIVHLERMSASVLNVLNAAQLNGQIDVDLVSKVLETSPEDEIKAIKNGVSERTGLKIGEVIEKVEDLAADPALTLESAVIHAAIDPKNEHMLSYEIWIATLSDADYYYFVTMLTPERNDEFFVWAQNSEAFERLVASMRVGSTLYDEGPPEIEPLPAQE